MDDDALPPLSQYKVRGDFSFMKAAIERVKISEAKRKASNNNVRSHESKATFSAKPILDDYLLSLHESVFPSSNISALEELCNEIEKESITTTSTTKSAVSSTMPVSEMPINITQTKPSLPRETLPKENLVFLDFSINGKHAGRVICRLFTDLVPITAENFRALCTCEKVVFTCFGFCLLLELMLFAGLRLSWQSCSSYRQKLRDPSW